MGQVTGLTAARMLEIENASIVAASIDGSGNLTLTNHGGDPVLTANVRGPQGPQGLQGIPGDVAAGGYVGTLQDAVDDAEAYSDLAGLGLVAMEQYGDDDFTHSGGVDAYYSIPSLSVSYAFVAGRSYRIEFGAHLTFGALSDHTNTANLDLMEGGNFTARASTPGQGNGKSGGANGVHLIKSSTWSGTKTLTLRLQKRTAAAITISNTTIPSFISIEDLGGRFV